MNFTENDGENKKYRFYKTLWINVYLCFCVAVKGYYSASTELDM